jgi:hypothetical protein
MPVICITISDLSRFIREIISSQIGLAVILKTPAIKSPLNYCILTHKVKQSHNTPMGKQGGGCIAPTRSRSRHYMGVSGQRHVPAALYPRGNDPRYPLYRRLGELQSWSGYRGLRKKLLPLPGIDPRLPGRPVLSQTLYWLSHPVSCFTQVPIIFNKAQGNEFKF